MDPLPRHSSEPVVGTPVSVGALLRREGRGRHALDRPLVPRGHSRPAPAPAAPARHGVRKVTAAAGALFAAGAVFGGTVLQEALRGPDVDGSAPGLDDAAGDPTSGQPGAERPDGAQPGAARLLLASETADLRPADPLPRASGADIGRDALAAATSAPGPDTAPPRASLPGDVTTGPEEPRSAGTVPGDPAPGDAAPGGPSGTGPTGGGPVGDGMDPEGANPERPAPGSPDPNGPGPATVDPDGPSPNAPMPSADPRTVPELDTPPVAVPGVAVPGIPVSTPTLALSAAVVDTPDLGLDVDDDGLTLTASRTAVTTPDLDVGEVDAGPLGVSRTGAELPDVAVGAVVDAPLLAVEDDPEVTVPEVRVSSATLTTPDVALGGATVEVPDLGTPELVTPEVPVVATVGGLLGL